MNHNFNFVLEKTQQPVLVVIEQKGSDEIECKERIVAGHHLFKEAMRHGILDAYLMVVGGANKGVQPETIRTWISTRDTDRFFIENKSDNTREKSLSIATYAAQRNIQTIFQVTSLYHSLRAYLTTIRAFSERGMTMPTLYNFVSDSIDLENISFVINDELSLAKQLNMNLQCRYSRSVSVPQKKDLGVEKYFLHRRGEAERLAAYSETGKNHLVTTVNTDDIIKTYVTIGQ